MILHASSAFDILEAEMKLADETIGTDTALTDKDGKAYCRLHVRLYEENSLGHIEQALKGIKVIIGDASPITASSSGPTAPITLSLTRADPSEKSFWSKLRNVLIDPLERAVETVVTKTADGLIQAIGAALPRTQQMAIGFALKRLADGLLLVYMPALILTADRQRAEDMRAMMIGMLLGVPRGLWAMGRDQIDQLKQVVVDLPRAIYNFFAEDPKFACEILASVINPLTAQVIYVVDDSFRTKINKAFARFANLAASLPEMVEKLWDSTKSHEGSFVSAIGGYIYDSFKGTAGDIATSYLGYKENDGNYRCFLCAFIAGDFLGYILGTVGLQIVIGYLTAGIGTILSSVVTFIGKVGPLAQAANLIVRIVGAFAELVNAIKSIVSTLGLAIKDGVMRVVLGLLSIVEALSAKLIMPVLEALADAAKAVFAMLLRYAAEEGARLRAIGLAIAGSVDDASAAIAKDMIETITILAEKGFIAAC